MILLISLSLAGAASANNGGIVDFSGNPDTQAGRDCNFCHSGGIAPVVLLSGPTAVGGGETHTYTLSISGGQQGACGLNVSANGGALSATHPATRFQSGEITHTGPLAVDAGGGCTFTFDWTAPFTDQDVTLYAAGNSVDQGQTTFGDAATTVDLEVAVTGLPIGMIPPVADADGPHASSVGVPVHFDGSGSHDDDGSIVAWDWDFGDGNAGSGEQPSYSYTAAGVYTVTLTVTDDDGFTGIDTTSVNIFATPPPIHSVRIIKDSQLQGCSAIASLPGDERIFVVRQGNVGGFSYQGGILIVENGALLTTPFLTIGPVGTAGSESGVRGLAFAPDYETSGYFYVLYSRAVNHDTVVSRFRVSATDPYVADPTFEEEIISVPQPGNGHRGSHIQFGPDGMLYVGLGDSDTRVNGQPGMSSALDPSSLLGKILRLDVSGSGPGYAIPPDNPFVGPTPPLDEIWASGLRNPFGLHFDPETGDFYIADVGQATWEELNVEPFDISGGRSYGWDLLEGDQCQVTPEPAECSDGTHTAPVYTYEHVEGGRCAIIGGSVYRGALPALQGRYFFADHCSDEIFSTVWNEETGISEVVEHTTELLPDIGTYDGITAIEPDGFGELLIYNRFSGEIFRILSTAPDGDGDLVPDFLDNCPDDYNRSQDDNDQDTLGDGCDSCPGSPEPMVLLCSVAGTACTVDGDCPMGETCNFVPDADGDDIQNSCDICPDDPDPRICADNSQTCRFDTDCLSGATCLPQANQDGDPFGDACDPDVDGDTIPDNFDGLGLPGERPCTGGATAGCDDNCPTAVNPAQEDADGDGAGDACDVCPQASDPGQEDADTDGAGDLCDSCVSDANPRECSVTGSACLLDADCPGGETCRQPDLDGDTIGDACDVCPQDSDPGQEDGDTDGAGDVCDNCASDPNGRECSVTGSACLLDADCPGGETCQQPDLDADMVGDVCDPDVDGDGIDDDGDGSGTPGDNPCPDRVTASCDDSCPTAMNAGQEDGDGDGVGDACDVCPQDADPGQSDADADGIGDACDNCGSDPNGRQCSLDSSACQVDADCPGGGICLQPDADADAIGDACDNCRDRPNPDQFDASGDGVGRLCDADYDDSGAVRGPDFIKLSESFGSSLGDANYDPDVDFDGNGYIGTPEFVLLSIQFGGAPGPGKPGCDGIVPVPAGCNP